MKKLFTSFLFLAFGAANAQNGVLTEDQQITKYPYHPNPKYLVRTKSYSGTRGSSKKETYTLSHTSFSRGVVDQSAGNYEQFYASFAGKLNTNFPNDSVNSMRWMTTVYDRLSTGFVNSGTVFPFNYNVNKSWLFLDSLDINVIYTKPNAARPDTLVITYWDRSVLTAGISTLDPINPIPAGAVLKRDTVIFTTALPKEANLFGGEGSTITRKIGRQLDSAKTFGVTLQFYGDISSNFVIPTIFMTKKSCSGNGTALNSYYESTSFYLNYKTATNDFSNVYTNQQNTLTYPSAPDCKRLYQQNFPIFVQVIDSVALSCEVIPNQHPLTGAFSTLVGETDRQCNGDNIDLRVCIGGELSTNLTYKWSNTQGAIDDKAAALPIYTQNHLSGKVFVTVYDGTTDSTTCSADVFSKGIKSTITGDTMPACGTTTMITCMPSGTSGSSNKYSWSGALSGTTTKIANSVDVGTYTVTVTNSFGCAATTSFKVQNPGVTNILDFDNKISYCKDAISTVTNNSSEKTGYKFVWYVAGAPVDSNDNGKVKFTSIGINQVTLTAVNNTTSCKSLPVTKSVTVKACSGITSFGNNTTMGIYPVPTNDQININISNLEQDGEIVVSNMVGEVVERRLVKSSSAINEMISLGRFSEGVYFIKLSAGNQSTTQKVILEK